MFNRSRFLFLVRGLRFSHTGMRKMIIQKNTDSGNNRNKVDEIKNLEGWKDRKNILGGGRGLMSIDALEALIQERQERPIQYIFNLSKEPENLKEEQKRRG